MIGFFALLAFSLSVAPQGPAAPAPAAARPAATVAIPFDPPLGQTLNYRLTSTETRGGQPQTMALDMRIVFRRDGDGYVVTATNDLPPGIPRGHPMVAVLLRPLELRLDADGAIVGMVDEPAYWAGIDAIMGDIVRSLGADARGAEAVRATFAAMRAMPDEERLALIARNVIPLFEYAGFEMEAGETRQNISETESPFGPIIQEVAVTLESARNDTARLRSVVRLAPGQIERLLRAIRERFGASALADGGNAAAQLPPERIETYEVSLRSGLTDRYTQSIGMPAAPGAAPAPPNSTRLLVRVP